jgi:hypothetical protein
MSENVDRKYYEVIRSHSLAERLLIRARMHIYEDFMRLMAPAEDDEIVDVGVSDTISDGTNGLERQYPFLEKITACGLGGGVDFRAAFPDCAYCKISPRARLPFPDKRFAIATANAVLEHVGGRHEQAEFLAELCRVARRVFVSVPHRFFPVEHHTALPLVHYFDRSFGWACRLTGKDDWAKEANLILMSGARLRSVAAAAGVTGTVGLTGLRLGPLSSNLFLAIR